MQTDGYPVRLWKRERFSNTPNRLRRRPSDAKILADGQRW
jgi:hypothetical protein